MPAKRSKNGAMSDTAKARVLKKCQKAYAVYVGLSMKIVVRRGYKRGDLSGHFTRERDAWRSALRRVSNRR